MHVYLITGFALDKRAFSLLDLGTERRANAKGDSGTGEIQYHFFDLIPVVKGESLREYALRLGQELGIKDGDIIGGVSLGGMLALEIAKVVKVRGVILIASCTHPRHIRRRFLAFAPLAPYVPNFLIRRVFLLIPQILKWQKMLSPTGQALLADIMGHFPPPLLRALPPMLKNWPGQIPPQNFRSIHSEGDWLIRPQGPQGPEVPGEPDGRRRILKGKNHLITVSHPKEVSTFIEESVAFFCSLRSNDQANRR